MKVLIVAKCIVNLTEVLTGNAGSLGINSSKVYCKCIQCFHNISDIYVLIVAKCIVNHSLSPFLIFIFLVLIVAKCIVNQK